MKKNIWMMLGLLLIMAALCLTVCNLYDGFRAEQFARQAKERLEKRMLQAGTAGAAEEGDFREIEVPDYILDPEMEMPEENLDGIDYVGILGIPALGLELPVISHWSYSGLKAAPCRYSGSAYLENLVIAAHNYPSHFGSLKKLSEGDEVIFTDMDGNGFHYEVAFVETLMPTALEEMTGSGYDLTLFTCTLGGQSRVTVRCERVI